MKEKLYASIAKSAARRLEDDTVKACTVRGVEHKNPITGELCQGEVVVVYSSWKAAQRSQTMKEVGSVAAICTTCGGGGFIDSKKKLVKHSERGKT
ncbi:hypothetical protein AMJ51_02420 [Microgenomates bacterium DG_75]|nr:MAG: hypothetical protein AMJ51_02420 [Microgenomates bacterium DG_75]